MSVIRSYHHILHLILFTGLLVFFDNGSVQADSPLLAEDSLLAEGSLFAEGSLLTNGSLMANGSTRVSNPPYPSTPPPHPRYLRLPPHPPSHSHRNKATATYLNCGFSDIEQKAEQGNIKLQLDLGRCFYLKVGADNETFGKGLGIQAPPPMIPRYISTALEILSKSLYWLRKAAEQNNADAKFYLAKAVRLKENLQSGKKNKMDLIQEKIKLQFRDCISNAKQSPDYPESAKKCRPFLFFATQRSEIDPWLNWANSKTHEDEYSEEAASWMRSAANTGHIRAQFMLAQYLIQGTGVAIDFVEAQAWRIVAANQNPVEGNEIRFRFITKQWLSDDEQAQAKILGRQYEKEYSDLWKNPSVTIFHD